MAGSSAKYITVQNIINAVPTGANVQVYTYIGSGSAGESNPNSAYFNIIPDACFIFKTTDYPFDELACDLIGGGSSNGGRFVTGAFCNVMIPAMLTSTPTNYRGFGVCSSINRNLSTGAASVEENGVNMGYFNYWGSGIELKWYTYGGYDASLQYNQQGVTYYVLGIQHNIG